ncbi:MAG: aminotransferase class IV [Planctomycetes bacterium]|nr:aminotransferase class IV [Planctomycetota bacterium]
MSNSPPIAYLNGRYLPIADANLHVFDLGIVGGMTVTEMVRTFQHVPFRLDQHLDRLAQSLAYVGFETGLTIADLRQICAHVIQVNLKLVSDWQELGLVIFVTAGQNLTYVGRSGYDKSPTVCVHTFPLPFELWADSYRTGLHLVTVNTRSIPDDVIDSRVKHRSRLHWHLAAREARQIDSGAMAILRDDVGRLTETATGNLCVVDGNTIITPAVHVLHGVSRNYLAELAASMGIGFVYGPVTPDDLTHADEAFLTSTPHCLLPVTRFNCAPIGSGKPGPVFQRLITAWGSAVGVDIVEQMQHRNAD